MMQVTYPMVCLVGVFFSFKYLKNVREMLLAGVVFSTYCLDSLPWNVVPIRGAAPMFHYALVSMCLMYFLISPNREKCLQAVFTKYNMYLCILFMLLLGYVSISYSQAYGWGKSWEFMGKCVVPVVALGLLGPISSREQKVIIHTVVFGSVLMVTNLITLGHLYYGRLADSGHGNPIDDARVIGDGLVLLLTYNLTKRSNKGTIFKRRVMVCCLTVLLVLYLIFGMLEAGSRGPLLSVGGALLVGFIVSSSGVRARVRAIGIVLGVLASGVLILRATPMLLSHDTGFNRLAFYITNFGNNQSDVGRLDRFQVAWDGIVSSHFLGSGTGDFAFLFGAPGREYPHNVLLETLLEQGVLGLFIVVKLFWTTGFSARVRLVRFGGLNQYTQSLYCMWAYSLLNSMVSGDIPANFDLWVNGGLVWMSSVYLLNHPRHEVYKIDRTTSTQAKVGT